MPKITKRGSKYYFRFFEKKGEMPTGFSFDTKKDAEKKLRELEYRKEHGTLIPTSTRTVSELLTKFCEEYGGEKWSASMHSSQTALIANYINPLIGNWRIQDITTDRANSYVRALKKVHTVESKFYKPRSEFVTDATRQKIVKLLRTAFRYAVKLELLEKNVFTKIDLPKYSETTRRAVTVAEYHSMVNYCNNEENRFLMIAIELAVFCSCRVGEITGLSWGNVHLDGSNPFVDIKQSLARESRVSLSASNITNTYFAFPTMEDSRTQLVLKQPKTASSVRRIFIPKQLVKILMTWKEEQEKHRANLGSVYHDYNLVIAQQNGDPVDANLIAKRLKKVCNELAIENVTFHCLRHTSASLKLKLSGGNYKAVQADTGHATTQMLLDRYAHVFEEDRIENAQKLGDALFSEEKTEDVDLQIKALLRNKTLLSRLLEKLQEEGIKNEPCTKSQKSCTAG
ncbi:MAG: site-specific integrase [Clostridia bacterium]|nr:site-specific integrase [Clostridia bacterium]